MSQIMMRGISMLGARLRWMRLGMWRTVAPIWFVLLFAFTACGTATINYRLTLEVEVNGVLHTGSSVIQTNWEWFSPWQRALAQRAYNVTAHGEAVVVDLGERGVLFALLTGPFYGDRWSGSYLTDPQQVLMRQILKHNLANQVDGVIPLEELAALSQRRDIIAVPPLDLPMLVHFHDVSDPLSVEQVDPNNLAASFGPGVKLVRASLAITNDPITTGIQDRLPWLSGLKGALNGNLISGPGLTGSIGVLNF
jgi:hypothetical protein